MPVTRISCDLPCSVKRGAGLWMGARMLPSIGPDEAEVRTGDV